MTKIKICGVTQADHAARVAAAGVEFIGLNFWPRSKRFLAADRAPAVAQAARDAGAALLVGVFVNAALDDIVALAGDVGLDILQLHGDETPAEATALAQRTGRVVWKAVAAGAASDLAALERWSVGAILLDAPAAGRGGSGTTFDWRLAREARERHPGQSIVLAGGLGPHNVAAAIAQVEPWAVDVASGVESAPGVQDHDKVASFVLAARARR